MQVLKAFRSAGTTYQPGDTYALNPADPQYAAWLTRKGFIGEAAAREVMADAPPRAATKGTKGAKGTAVEGRI